ncbi:MAG: mechanosensitive ion channel family protein [Spirulinaceae cyanobacterium]
MKARWVQGFWAAVLGVLLWVGVGHSLVWAQITGLDISIDDITNSPNVPTVQLGDLEVAPVFLEGKAVLTVASELNATIGNDGTRQVPPAAFRSQQISQRLRLVLARMLTYSRRELPDLVSLKEKEAALKRELVMVSQRSTDEAAVYRLRVAFPSDAPPELIATLTEVDARYRRQSLDELAPLWQDQLVRVLLAAWRSHQPALLGWALGQATIYLGISAVLSTLIWLLQRVLRRQRKRQKALQRPDSADDPDNPLELLGNQVRRLNRLRDRNLNRFLRRLLFWGQMLLWVVSWGLICRLFYFTRPFANWLLGVSPQEWLLSFGQQGIVGTPILLLLWFLAINLSERLAGFVIERVAQEWLINHTEPRHPPGHTGQATGQRFSLRVPTLVNAAQGVIRIVAYSIFLLLALNQFRAIAAPLTALLGIITFAISLGAQNFIKDVINGILILLEDQYAVGDVIAINGDAAGLVEQVNLRITQLRSLDGELITIPNGSVGVVRNMTSEWSQAKCSITVSHQSDLERAMALMVEVAEALYGDAGWRDRTLDQPELLGVENIDHHGPQIWILLKAKPMQHWDLAREYRRRLTVAFAEAGIDFGAPRQEVLFWPAAPLKTT